MARTLSPQLQKDVTDFIAIAKRMTEGGVTRQILKDLTLELEKLGDKKVLFPRSEFPPPDGPTNILYQLSCDPDGQYALYLSSANKGKSTPPHNHATWAVIVGIEGDERNKLYRRLDDGTSNENVELEMTGEQMVREGQPISLMPQDIHSIHVESDEPTLHLHLYGRRLEDLKERLQFDMARRTASHFPPNPNIR